MSAIEALAGRLQTLRHSNHPLGVDAAGAAALTQALRGGTEVHVALAQLKAPGGLPRLIDVAKPADPVALTDQLLTPLADASNRRQALRAMAAYPTMVLITVVLAAVTTQVLAVPALRTLTADLSSALNEGALLAAFAFSIGMLVLTTVAVALETPFSPLRGVLRRIQRVLTLEATSVLCDHGVPVHRAFEAASALAKDPALHRATLEVAAALSAGRAPAGNALLDETAGRLVFAAASKGVGGPVTKALARHARSAALRAMSIGSQGVQLFALLFAALALLAVAASWVQTYAAALAVGA